jgi:ATP-dependent Clp protease protease subunit
VIERRELLWANALPASMSRASYSRDRKPRGAVAGAGEKTLYLFDEIGPHGTGMLCAKDVVGSLASMGYPDSVHVMVSSAGGDAFEAIAIYDALIQRCKKIRVSIIGAVEGAAAVIPMAGDSIAIAQSSVIILDNPRTLAIGEAEDLRFEADLLEIVRGSMIDILAERSGQTDGEIGRLMDAGAVIDSRMAVAMGLATSVVPNKKPTPGVDAVVRNVRLAELEGFIQQGMARKPDGFASG